MPKTLQELQVGPMTVAVHRTVRVPEGESAPARLPPSLGIMELHSVGDYREHCPKSWEDNAVFVVMHDVEACWLSFSQGTVNAAIIGAGGVNALTGEDLTAKLAKDNYLVAPPQPWLDGWKDKSGSVYQFVATSYEGGTGKTVAEQLIGTKSKSGGIGIAVFEPKDRSKVMPMPRPGGTWLGSDQEQKTSGGIVLEACSFGFSNDTKGTMRGASRGFGELGVGKGGKIEQKVYPDPHGLEVWKTEPTAVRAIYIVNAKAWAEITGKPVPPSPVTSSGYKGAYYGMQDKCMADNAGSSKFEKLQDAVPANTGVGSVFQPADSK
jgi:hypothetical protein